MSVINTNVSSLIAQNILAQNNSALNTSLERLSTGLQINSGADNPSGLIAVESFNQENTGLTTAINNAGLANNVIGTAAGGLSQVSDLLTQLQGLLGQAANTGGLSTDQVNADQLQVDSILNTINRIAGNTNFEGKALLNGNLDYVTSGLKTSALQNLQINSALVPDTGPLEVDVQVTGSASQAVVTTTVGTVTGTAATTLEIEGSLGSTELTFASGAHASAIANAINLVADQTGVVASATLSGSASTGLALISSAYGSSQFVTVKTVAGTYDFNGTGFGTDASVTVNGSQANVQGLQVNYSTSGLDLDLDLAQGLNQTGSNESFYITGGGATFALGALVDDSGKVSVGIGNISTASLGNASYGYLDSLVGGGVNDLSSNNLNTAQQIVTAAIQQVADLSGRLGAFQDYTVGSTVAALNVAYENSSAAESSIEDTNFASETSNLTRAQILAQASTTVLAQANSTPEEALNLLKAV
ncbi:MAG TPA: flagellin [Tepidisphaeraceae bacterium]|nr:flagellin [Tepidisphaeraceae bacterium]